MEDGFNAGWRNIGTLALWVIPLVLGLAAATWLALRSYRRLLAPR